MTRTLDSSEDCQSQITSKLTISNKDHTCNNSCCSLLRFVPNNNKVNLRDFLTYTYYNNLAPI